MASQFTGMSQRKNQCPASLGYCDVTGEFPDNLPVMRKAFPWNHVIMSKQTKDPVVGVNKTPTWHARADAIHYESQLGATSFEYVYVANVESCSIAPHVLAKTNIDGLVQDCSSSIANALDIL